MATTYTSHHPPPPAAATGATQAQAQGTPPPRRQSSTTSLSKYVRTRTEPTLEQRSLDFCNAFWGLGDGGVDVLLARIRGATRTIDEVRAFYKERAAIEEDYAKRLNRLAKMNVGRDEIGELRNSIDSLRLETDKQASSHLNLAQSIKQDCDIPLSEFTQKVASHRKNFTAAVERFFKNKQTQESYVAKAREKYEQDCNRINFCTAKLSIEQGRELEKTQVRLERAKQSVVGSEKEYQNFVRALKDTSARWEKEWKGYCDRCQDIEEERIEFLKDCFWTYANCVATVCVSDDESCETLRVALEQLEPEKDVENFVRDYGTGSLIPEAPPFIDYSAADPRPPPTRPRHANFARSSMRPMGINFTERGERDRTPEEEQFEEEATLNAAGIGAGGGAFARGRDSAPTSPGPDRNQAQSRASSKGRQNASAPTTSRPNSIYSGGPAPSSSLPKTSTMSDIAQAAARPIRPLSTGPGPASGPIGRFVNQGANQPPPSNSLPNVPTSNSGPALASEFKPARDPHAAPVDPTSATMIKIGDRAYPADPSRDPQSTLARRMTARVPPPSSGGGAAPGANGGNVGGNEDPLLRQMNELQKEGSLRRNASHLNGKPGAANVVAGGRPIHTPTSATSPSSTNANLARATSPAARPTSGLGLVPPTPASATGTSSTHTNQRSSIDYHAAAEDLIGAHPASRPTSPAGSPPTSNSGPIAHHMQPPPPSTSSPHLPVDEVMSNYQQRLPGERPVSGPVSVGGSSRRNSTISSGHANRDSHMEVPIAGIQRPASREGHAGIGAHGRASPQPGGRPLSRGPSPGPSPGQLINGNGGGVGMGMMGGQGQAGSGPVGIRLDSQGRVIQDSRADAYGGPGPQGYAAPPGGPQPPPPQGDPRASMYGRPPSMMGQLPQPQQQPGRMGQNPPQQQGPPPSQRQSPPGYPANYQGHPGAVQRSPSPQPGYPGAGAGRGWQGGPQPPQQIYGQPGPVGAPGRINTDVGGPSVHRQSTLLYNPHSAATPRYSGPPQQQQQQQLQRQSSYGFVQNPMPPQQQSPPQQQPYVGQTYVPGSVGYAANGMQRNSYYPGQQPPQQQPPPPQQQPAQHPGYRASVVPQQQPGQMQRAPSPQPPPQSSQPVYGDEAAILFYVKALYDYKATIDEEFDFQANDIIAVTSTPDDGWWTGILLDESRRVPNRNVFPSNFVTFF